MQTISIPMEDQTLARKAIAEMSSDDYTALRDAYYKAMEGLNALQRELQGIKDRDAAISVPLIIEVSGDAEAAREALSDTYDAPEVTELRVYNIGDGEAMSGLLLAGRRENGEATFLTVLMD